MAAALQLIGLWGSPLAAVQNVAATPPFTSAPQLAGFVHPALAAAALAAGVIPLIVHLVNRRRYVRVRWAAMAFLLAANRRSVKRVRLEQITLMLMRIALIVLFGLALARPYLSSSSVLRLGASPVHRVLVVDNSLSMSARGKDEPTRRQEADRVARRLVESFPPSDAVSLITLAAPGETVIAHAALDRRFVRDRLAALRPTHRAADAGGALRAAAKVLTESTFPPTNRAVYVVSDFPSHVWTRASADDPTPAAVALRRLADLLADPAVDLHLVNVAPGTVENLSLTALTAPSGLIGVQHPVRVAAEVTNFGLTTARGALLEIRRDGHIVRREPLPAIEVGASAAMTMTLAFATPGTHLIEARISGSDRWDALPDDDVRFLSLEVPSGVAVLLVDGQPGATKLAGEAGFLATALAPDAAGTPPPLLVPHVITAPELESEVLSDYAVIALCNVRRLPESSWRRLEAFVAAGGGLDVFVGDRVSADHYNRFGHAAGEGMLPAAVTGPARDASARDDSLGYALTDPVHPLVTPFTGHPDSGLFLARVQRYLPLRLDDHRGAVVLRYTNNDPALVASVYGKGRVMLWSTTANLAWNNLPAKGDFVSMTLATMAFLTPHRGQHRNLLVGQALREPLTPAQHALSLRVDLAGGRSAVPSLIPESDGLTLTYGPVERASAPVVSIGARQRIFAVNVDTSESALTPVGQRDLAAVLDRPFRWAADPTSVMPRRIPRRAQTLSLSLVYLVAALLLVEMWLAMWFGSPRSAAGGHTPGAVEAKP